MVHRTFIHNRLLRRRLPTTMDISGCKIHEVDVVNRAPPTVAAVLVMDRGYVALGRLLRINATGGLFVTSGASDVSARRR